MKLKALIAASTALVLTACNPMEQVEVADAKVARFQATYNEGDARGLYGQTSDEFREVTTPQQMDELVEYVTDKMGAIESSERSGININSSNGVNQTTVTMTTTFAKGEGTETYTFIGSGEEMRLAGWNVDADNFADDAVEEGEAQEEPVQ